ncbi:hypothetical protein GCM10020001_094100 [Nonomuraea salmonea]
MPSFPVGRPVEAGDAVTGDLHGGARSSSSDWGDVPPTPCNRISTTPDKPSGRRPSPAATLRAGSSCPVLAVVMAPPPSAGDSMMNPAGATAHE